MELRAHWKAYLVGAVLLVAVLAIGGPFVYARYLAPEAAAPLSVGTPPQSSRADRSAGERLRRRAGFGGRVPGE